MVSWNSMRRWWSAARHEGRSWETMELVRPFLSRCRTRGSAGDENEEDVHRWEGRSGAEGDQLKEQAWAVARDKGSSVASRRWRVKMLIRTDWTTSSNSRQLKQCRPRKRTWGLILCSSSNKDRWRMTAEQGFGLKRWWIADKLTSKNGGTEVTVSWYLRSEWNGKMLEEKVEYPWEYAEIL